jgi:hypothetical protein
MVAVAIAAVICELVGLVRYAAPLSLVSIASFVRSSYRFADRMKEIGQYNNGQSV